MWGIYYVEDLCSRYLQQLQFNISHRNCWSYSIQYRFFYSESVKVIQRYFKMSCSTVPHYSKLYDLLFSLSINLKTVTIFRLQSVGGPQMDIVYTCDRHTESHVILTPNPIHKPNLIAGSVCVCRGSTLDKWAQRRSPFACWEKSSEII